ncbi:MAG: TraR/DksA family transcriptional regulator [Halobacteriovoraceae bacterium]|nr:TraR/DksA family transcriptional regulator [Halobacteriovoraceae bacterium]MCB9093595.1 TraR/DksA family transcriptional regulator [Halobacteriovoraceae bacterium]
MAKRMNSHLKKKELDNLKQKLLSEEERIVNKQLAKKIEFKLQAPSESKDEVDSANDSILVYSDLRLSNRELLYLKKVRKAIQKLQTDEYGICEDCGDQINYQRLTARPTSELCIVCKEECEREENQSAYSKSSKSLGQQINLVKGF